jgi:hypothetical protein
VRSRRVSQARLVTIKYVGWRNPLQLPCEVLEVSSNLVRRNGSSRSADVISFPDVHFSIRLGNARVRVGVWYDENFIEKYRRYGTLPVAV